MNKMTPPDYKCARCGAENQKLWRDYGVSEMALFCRPCTILEAKIDHVAPSQIEIDWFVPAVPTDDGQSLWGYTSIPAAGWGWWWSLPPNLTGEDEARSKHFFELAPLEEQEKLEYRKTTDAELDNLFKSTRYLIEATTFEKMCIWEKWSKKVSWEHVSLGFFGKIGALDHRPITASVFFARVLGHVVAFYESPSVVQDSLQLEAWLKTKVPENTPKTNVMNFHNCILDLERLS